MVISQDAAMEILAHISLNLAYITRRFRDNAISRLTSFSETLASSAFNATASETRDSWDQLIPTMRFDRATL
jgi:hypothetical protein